MTTPQHTLSGLAPKADVGFSKAIQAYQAPKEKKEPNWELVESHLPLLKSMVNKLRPSFPAHMDIQDIHSVALAGLISASQLFDPQKNVSFGNYAKIRIRGALIDEMRKMDWMSRSERLTAKNYQKTVADLTVELNQEPDDGQIESRMGISHAEHLRIKEQSQPIYIIALDQIDNSSSDTELVNFHDLIPDITEMNARDVSESHDTLSLLRKGLETLDDIPKKILALYYLEGLKLLEIAYLLKLSESRVCQIHNKALQDLRKFIFSKD